MGHPNPKTFRERRQARLLPRWCYMRVDDALGRLTAWFGRLVTP